MPTHEKLKISPGAIVLAGRASHDYKAFERLSKPEKAAAMKHSVAYCLLALRYQAQILQHVEFLSNPVLKTLWDSVFDDQ